MIAIAALAVLFASVRALMFIAGLTGISVSLNGSSVGISLSLAPTPMPSDLSTTGGAFVPYSRQLYVQIPGTAVAVLVALFIAPLGLAAYCVLRWNRAKRPRRNETGTVSDHDRRDVTP
jgi:hypothetical protein